MTLSELKARVDAAEGGDREIDCEIALAFQTPNEHYTKPLRRPILIAPENRFPGTLEYVDISGVSARAAPAYTSSLDAALGLVEAKLPGWGVEICTPDKGKWRGQLWRWVSHGSSDGEWEPCYAPTPSLALLSALLSALMAEEVMA